MNTLHRDLANATRDLADVRTYARDLAQINTDLREQVSGYRRILAEAYRKQDEQAGLLYALVVGKDEAKREAAKAEVIDANLRRS